jgi:hypothetical protein
MPRPKKLRNAATARNAPALRVAPPTTALASAMFANAANPKPRLRNANARTAFVPLPTAPTALKVAKAAPPAAKRLVPRNAAKRVTNPAAKKAKKATNPAVKRVRNLAAKKARKPQNNC